MAETPTANINQAPSTGGFWQNAIDNLLNLYDNGKEIYQDVTGRTLAGEKIQKETVAPVVTTVEPKTIFGMTQNQTLIIAGVLAVVLIVSISRRK